MRRSTKRALGPPAVLMIAYTDYSTDPRVIRAAEAAAEAGFRVDVLTLRRHGEAPVETMGEVRVLRLPQQRYRARSRTGYVRAYASYFARCFIAAARLHLRGRYRVVHVHNMPDVLVFAALIPRILGAKLLLDIHDPMPETFAAKYAGEAGRQGVLYQLLLAMERLSVAFAHQTITVNEPVRDNVLVRHGYRRESIGVVSNFADDRLFKVLPCPPLGSPVRFVFHGTILARYGLRTLVEAVAKAQERDRIRVRIIGEGDFSTELNELIRCLGLSGTIDFQNRVFPLHEIPRLLADCHVGLVPLDVTPISNFALPLKLIEYTCLGLPSVTVPSTAITHYLRPEECFLYPPGDSDAMAAVIDRIARQPACLAEYRMRLTHARARMSWTREKEKYVDLLRSLSGLPGTASVPIGG